MQIGSMTVTAHNNTVENSTVTMVNVTENSAPDAQQPDYDAFLKDVQALRDELKKRGKLDAEVSYKMEKLQKAVEGKDQSKAQEIWKGFSDAVKDVATGLITNALSLWLGIS